jgi:hypothetical protein
MAWLYSFELYLTDSQLLSTVQLWTTPSRFHQSVNARAVSHAVETPVPTMLEWNMYTDTAKDYVTQFNIFRKHCLPAAAYIVFCTRIWLMPARFQLSTGGFFFVSIVAVDVSIGYKILVSCHWRWVSRTGHPLPCSTQMYMWVWQVSCTVLAQFRNVQLWMQTSCYSYSISEKF